MRLSAVGGSDTSRGARGRKPSEPTLGRDALGAWIVGTVRPHRGGAGSWVAWCRWLEELDWVSGGSSSMICGLSGLVTISLRTFTAALGERPSGDGRFG